MLHEQASVNVPVEKVSNLSILQHARKSAKEYPFFKRLMLFIAGASLLTMNAGSAAGLGIFAYEVWDFVFSSLISHPFLVTVVCKGMGLCVGYLTYGISLLVITPMTNRIFSLSLDHRESEVSKNSAAIWYLHNSIHYVVRYTFLEWTLLSPVVSFYLRLMGARIGSDVVINSSALSDVSLLTIESNVVIGGGAKVMAHYSDSEAIVFAAVILKRGSAVGCNSVILGGVTIGEGAKVLPNSYVKPNTFIPAGEVWAGVPAKRVLDKSDCI